MKSAQNRILFKKHNLNDKLIKVSYTNDNSVYGDCEWVDDNNFLIRINPDMCENTEDFNETIIHELQHIWMAANGYNFYTHNFLFVKARNSIIRTLDTDWVIDNFDRLTKRKKSIRLSEYIL